MGNPVISLKPSYNSYVRGCPGIPDTMPRVECEIRIRSDDACCIMVESVEFKLKTTEELLQAGPIMNKAERTTVHYRRILRLNKKILGVDIPVTIAIPDTIKATNSNSKGHTFTTMEIIVSGGKHVVSHSMMINIEKYDMLPHTVPPIDENILSTDNKLNVLYSIKNPCVAADDFLHVFIDISPNLVNFSSIRKIKLKSITFDVMELLEISDIQDIKQSVIASVTKDCNEVIYSSGVKFESDIKISSLNRGYKLFTAQMNHVEMPTKPGAPNQIYILKSKTPEPLKYNSSISTRGGFFNFTHQLVMRFKLSNAKDFEIVQPIDISPILKDQMFLVEDIIYREREIANEARMFYNNYGGIKRLQDGTVEYPLLHPKFYFEDPETMSCLNLEKRNGKQVPYID